MPKPIKLLPALPGAKPCEHVMRYLRPAWVSDAINFKRAVGDLDNATLDDHFHADALAVAYSGGQGASACALGYFHHVAKVGRTAPHPCVLWNSETRRPMTHDEIAGQIGISADKLGGKSRGVINTLETAKLIVVDRTDRDWLGRKIGDAIALAKGSYRSHLKKLRSNGAALTAKMRLLLEIQDDWTLEDGFAAVRISKLAKDTGVGERAARDLVRELIADGILVAVGLNRLSFGAKAYGANAFGPYDGPVFGDKPPSNYQLDVTKVQEVKVQAGSFENTGGGRENTGMYTDSLPLLSTVERKRPEGARPPTCSVTAAPLTTGLARAGAAPSGAADGELHVAASRMSFLEFQAKVWAKLGSKLGGGNLASLTQDDRYELMSDAVRGRMSDRRIAENREQGLALFQKWLEGWAGTNFAADLLFFEMFWKADTQRHISIWGLIDLRITDLIERGRDEQAERIAFLEMLGTPNGPAPERSPTIATAAPVEVRKAPEPSADSRALSTYEEVDRDIREFAAHMEEVQKERDAHSSGPSSAPKPRTPSATVRKVAGGDGLADEIVALFADTPSANAFVAYQVGQMLTPRVRRLGEERVRDIVRPAIASILQSGRSVRPRDIGKLIDEGASS